jgi:rubrerythrin
MNNELVAVIKRIIAEHGEDILANPQRLKGYVSDYAAAESKSERLVFGRCIEHGAYTELKNAPDAEARLRVKAALAQRVHNNEGLDVALCNDALDTLEAAMFDEKNICQNCGKTLQEGWVSCPFCGAGKTSHPQKQTVSPKSASTVLRKRRPRYMLFPISTFLILLIAVAVTVHMNRRGRMVEIATQNHLREAALAAASFLTVEELDQFHTVEDMEKPAWDDIRQRLIDFAEQYQVLYVYYWRDYGDGNIQYIIDNVMDLESMCTPGMLFPMEDISTSIIVGNIYVTDFPIDDWSGLISGAAPVYNEDGSVYCAAGVDISDEIFLIQRENMRIMQTVLLFALGFFLIASGIGIRFYCKKTLCNNTNKEE